MLILLSLAAASAAAAPGSPVASPSPLDPTDQATLQRAEAHGRTHVTLVIAAESDRVNQVVNGVRSLGGTVVERQNRIDYVNALVPIESAPKVAKLSAVEALDVDRLVPLEDPRVQGQAPAAPQDPPGASTARSNPYLPIQDTGAAEFGEVPDQDGRGVKVAILDTGIDLSQPALATTSTSQLKVVDWFDATRPESTLGSWVATEGRVNGNFTREGETWVAPASGGPYAFGTLKEDAGDLANDPVGGDLNRNGVVGETFGVLQDRDTKEVYVDTDQDRDFTDDHAPMLDYGVAHDFSFFGVDDPGTPLREQMAFSVGTGRSEYEAGTDEGSWVNIGISGADHGTHVAGIVGATAMFGGEMGGAAPGAQLMSVKVCPVGTGCSLSAMLDGMVYAAENGADVANMSVGGATALNDGNNARAELYNRLIDEYGMQIFLSAGNDGGGANTVDDPAVATDAVSVAASITQESWLANYGQENETGIGLMPFSSRGPSEGGAMKPDLTAPGSAVSTTLEWRPGVSVDGIYTLPPGYSMLNGTSMAAPQAAGAAALLVGAYKHEFGSRPSPAALRNALTSTADFLPGVPAHGQGAGLIDVDAAWQQLRLAAPVAPSKISASVPVNTVISQFLKVPGTGVGIHEREGVKAGDELTRTYTLTRASGPAGERTFQVSWKGNDGTFTAASTVTLPLDTPTELPVQVHPANAGIHSALLRLDDPDSTGIDLTTENVVFATAPLADSRVSKSGTVGRGGTESILIDVPAGTPALRVEMDAGGPAPEQGQARFRMFNPQGLAAEEMTTSQCFNPDAGDGCPVGSATARTTANPMAGVWEVVIEGFRGSSVQETPFTLSASLLEASVSPDPDEVRAQDYVPVARTYEATNEGGAFAGRMVGGPLSSTRIDRPQISQGGQQQFPVQVPAGIERLQAEVGNLADPGGDLDLLLYNCTAGSCFVAAQSASSSSQEKVHVDNPAPGSWIVLVDGYSVPSGSTLYDYRDDLSSASLYGELTVDDSDAARAAGESWSADATFAPVSGAPSGRKLTGEVRVVDAGGAAIARGLVNFEIDTTPPDTTITSGPETPGNDATPSFTFESDEPGTFRCSLDETPFTACESPLTLGPLEDGEHSLAVRAVDHASNEDATPATATFEIDATPPEVQITGGPPAVGTNRSPTFVFVAAEPGATFECRLDGGNWEACASSFTAHDLADGEDGEHLFEVRATDSLGNTSIPVSSEFTLTAPTTLAATIDTVAGKGADLRISASATLTHARTGEAVVGRTIDFSVAGVPLCHGTTDGTGRAECTGTPTAADLKIGDPYEASFAGEPRFAAASAAGSLPEIPHTDPPDTDPPDTDPPDKGGKACPAVPRRFKLRGFFPKPPFGQSRRVLGLRVGISTGSKVKATISPRVRYRIGGKARVARLRTRTIKVGGAKKIRFLLPKKMRRDFRRSATRLAGAPVTLVIAVRLRRMNAPARCARSVGTRHLRTNVVGVAGRAALRRRGTRHGLNGA